MIATLTYIGTHLHSLTDWLTRSLTHSLTYPPTHSLTHSHTHSLTHSFTHSFTHSLTHSITHPHHSLAHSFTHSRTQSLILIFTCTHRSVADSDVNHLTLKIPQALRKYMYVYTCIKWMHLTIFLYLCIRWCKTKLWISGIEYIHVYTWPHIVTWLSCDFMSWSHVYILTLKNSHDHHVTTVEHVFGEGETDKQSWGDVLR